MTVVVVLAFSVVLLGLIVALWRDNQRLRRDAARAEMSHAQERQQLLDRIMYLTGRAWTPPPTFEAEHEAEPEDPWAPYDPLASPLSDV